MTHTIKLWIASDCTKGSTRTAESDTLDIVEIAQKHGRGDGGEIVSLLEVDGVETDVESRPTAHWDSVYRKYRSQQ